MKHKISVFLEELPSIMSLIKRDYQIDRQDKDELRGDTDVLTIILFEDENELSSPNRLIIALEGLTKLYEACARMENVSTNSISVLACDSGSDKSFDFLGVAKVFEQVRHIINDMWDKIVYFRYLEEEKRIELVTKHLNILESTSVLSNDNHISNEEAEIIKKLVISGVSKLMKAGVATEELDHRKVQDPRILLSPEPKLLTAISSESDNGEVKTEKNYSDRGADQKIVGLTRSEIEQLKGLVSKTDSNPDDSNQ